VSLGKSSRSPLPRPAFQPERGTAVDLAPTGDPRPAIGRRGLGALITARPVLRLEAVEQGAHLGTQRLLALASLAEKFTERTSCHSRFIGRTDRSPEWPGGATITRRHLRPRLARPMIAAFRIPRTGGSDLDSTASRSRLGSAVAGAARVTSGFPSPPRLRGGPSSGLAPIPAVWRLTTKPGLHVGGPETDVRPNRSSVFRSSPRRSQPGSRGESSQLT
jgi:hypothetical protein